MYFTRLLLLLVLCIVLPFKYTAAGAMTHCEPMTGVAADQHQVVAIDCHSSPQDSGAAGWSQCADCHACAAAAAPALTAWLHGSTLSVRFGTVAVAANQTVLEQPFRPPAGFPA